MPTLTRNPADEAAHTHRLTQLLAARYAGRHPADHIAEVVAHAHERFASARVRIFVPVLVERIARETLDPAPAHEIPPATSAPPAAPGTPVTRRPAVVRLGIALLTFFGLRPSRSQ